MCGIYGYFDRAGQRLEGGMLEAAARTIAHRGPDDHGVFEGNGVALGNQRLSIIDLAGGHQPFFSDDGKIVVVQNGEIYNHVELARELAVDGYHCRTSSDTEVLLRLFERDGPAFVSRLNGMFAIAIYDGRENALYLYRDRIGVKPLYVHDDGKRLVFGSEIKTLLAAGVRPLLDDESLHHYLSFNYVPPPRTMFRHVRHLPAGTFLRVTTGGAAERRWWNLGELHPEERTEREWIDVINDTLSDAVRLRLRCDVPFGAFLSGGVDSSTVVGLMARHMDQPVRTFSIGFHDARFDESEYADEAARRFGTAHVSERVDTDMLSLWPLATFHCDQPHGDTSFIPTYRLSQLAIRHVKVVLTGDGGDELFAGYDKYRDFFASPEVLETPESAFRESYYRNIMLFDDQAKVTLYSEKRAAALQGVDSRSVLRPLFDQSLHMDRINRALYIDMLLLLAGNNLVKPDRMGMAVSLEARTPFLDYRMMELAFRMPGEMKLRNGETKYILKKAVEPLIGHRLAYRPKQMFTVPVGEWLKGAHAGYAAELLLSERASAREFFKTPVVARMIRDHQSGRSNFTRELRALIALEIWCRQFLDGDMLGEVGRRTGAALVEG